MGNDFKITFSIDLAPYISGLKTMLTMTQAAGQQIQPLLNMQVSAPDFMQLEQALAQYQQELQATIDSQTNASAGTQKLGNEHQRTAGKTNAHTMTMRTMKRESLEVFGALSFVATSLVSIAANASGGDEKLQKMGRSMSQGISAGFGLASMMSLLGFATGGTAVAIGGAVAVGITLVDFFVNSEEKAAAAKKAIDNFTGALRGGSLGALIQYKSAIDAAIKITEGSIKAIEDAATSWNKNDRKVFNPSRTQIMQLEGYKTQLATLQQQSAALGEMITKQSMTDAEAVKLAEKRKIESITDRFERQRQMAKTQASDEIALVNNSIQNETIRKNAVEGIRADLQTKIAEINSQEQKAQEQAQTDLASEYFEELNRQMEAEQELAQLRSETQLAVLEANKILELSTAKTGAQRVKVEKKYALEVLEVEHQLALANATTYDQIIAIGDKYLALREKINAQSSFDFKKATENDTETAKRSAEENINLFKEQNKTHMAVIDSLNSGISSMWNNFIVDHRQAKDNWDAAWLAMKNTALTALGDMLVKMVENYLVSQAMSAATVPVVITEMGAISAAAAMPATLVSIATMGGAAGIGTAAIMSSLATVQALSVIPKLEEGGRINEGSIGFFEGKAAEIVAPEKTFLQIMKAELIPQIILAQDEFNSKRIVQQFNDNSYNNMLTELRELKSILRKQQHKTIITGAMDGQEFFDKNFKKAEYRKNITTR